MPFFKLLVFNMGKHKEGCEDCSESCDFRIGDKCKLYSCHECGGFLEEDDPVVRVVFQATHKMESRRKFLYGKGITREPRDALAFVTFHVGCYKKQLEGWIDIQLKQKVTR